jgi:hypothetical protein
MSNQPQNAHDAREPHERTMLQDVRVLASLAELKEELGDSDAGHEIERALALELEHLEHKLRDTAQLLLRAATDEARLQAHLGVLEAHERLGSLEPFLRSVRKPIAAMNEAKLQMSLATMELHGVVDDRRSRARAEVARIARATEHALEKLSERIDAITVALRTVS